MCRRSWAVVTPVKYEFKEINLTGGFARSKNLFTEILTNGALANPTLGNGRHVSCLQKNMSMWLKLDQLRIIVYYGITLVRHKKPGSTAKCIAQNKKGRFVTKIPVRHKNAQPSLYHLILRLLNTLPLLLITSFTLSPRVLHKQRPRSPGQFSLNDPRHRSIHDALHIYFNKRRLNNHYCHDLTCVWSMLQIVLRLRYLNWNRHMSMVFV